MWHVGAANLPLPQSDPLSHCSDWIPLIKASLLQTPSIFHPQPPSSSFWASAEMFQQYPRGGIEEDLVKEPETREGLFHLTSLNGTEPLQENLAVAGWMWDLIILTHPQKDVLPIRSV